ncbi:rRNA-binding ribosome biosynthesis protein UTP23 ASCRUDRAFT_39365 [Ascoidea rubescens DSM 1968]|uniref:U three protein 23 n=1 Tax=Ascoidea rubescens DSM 1968 TaxID=1344418 RepID=A0A1D2V9W4_9ASCO|nr:hypothetical protein ASCRUDRAFT_39365 [Ascoidea rubescens DSM 1968]ODV58424.1 hypothetical protein ASCRUDRAFT_39365 [Ascoidea rubescens DSM 1968]
MRQKRAKAYRKNMLVYNHTFKFREPYQVIIDDQVILKAINAKFDLVKVLKKTIQAEIKPMITQCCIQVLYRTKNQEAIELAKKFERRRCGHLPKEPETPHKCILSITNVNNNNKFRYIIVTQNEVLRKELRKVPGVPLIYINKTGVLVMEPLSDMTEKARKIYEKSKLSEGLNNAKTAGIREQKSTEGEDDSKPKKKRKRGPKEPNPLSIKKKKTQKPPTNGTAKDLAEQDTEKKKRKRKHKKTSKNEPALTHQDSAKADSSGGSSV